MLLAFIFFFFQIRNANKKRPRGVYLFFFLNVKRPEDICLNFFFFQMREYEVEISGRLNFFFSTEEISLGLLNVLEPPQ